MISDSVKILFLLFLLFPLAGQSQSIQSIRKQKERSEKEIAYLNKLLEGARSDQSVSMEKLNLVQQKIVKSKQLLHSLNQEVFYLQSKIEENEKRLGELENDKSSLLDLYARLVYGTWKKRNKTDKLMFILSSSDFNQAYHRFKYFRQIQEYSHRQLDLIKIVNDSLDVKNRELRNLVAEKNLLLEDIQVQNKALEKQQAQEKQYVSELRQREKELRKKLETEIVNRKKLAQKLEKLIAAQVKKSGSKSSVYRMTPNEKIISDDFAKNKGRLPWPVKEGFISEKFGVHVHPIHKRIQMFNNGISITTSRQAEVRAVFDGEISEILFMPGFNNVVIIRHGSYLTLYSNLMDVVVRKGQKIKTKDIIGKMAYDKEKGSILNFQVWKNTEKLNPELWLVK